ncbi:MAG: hypothetical protein IT342_17225 [Candidatus Melainabacteria bacterium]|nr:hypothetical protein [Candidatus Melainabacteria bacterium]
MSKRTLIGLMFCTLFLSAPAFAQQSTALPVIQTAQAVQNDVTIPEGTTQVFDAAQGEIQFDGTLTNKGTIIIKSSNPAQVEAVLSAAKFVNEGRIVSEVPSLTINASILGGTGDYNAPETINVRGTDRLEIRGGRFYSEWFRPKTKGWLIINANRIDGKVELEAEHLSMGVREGNLNVVKQKLDGDPLIYNTGGDITTPIAPSGGHDLLIIASGDVIVSGGIDATGSATQDEGNIAILTGAHFARPHDGEVILPCGISNGQGNDCNNLADSMSLPGMPLEPAQGDFPMSGKIVISGEVRAHVIIMTSREIEINGNLHAVEDGMLDGAAISLFATKSITVTGTIKADANTVEPSFSAVSLIAPTVNVSNKITSDAVTIEAFENSEASTGSVTTAAIEARRYLDINGGHIQFGEAGGAFTGGVLPLSQPHDSGEFTIKTGKLTAHQFINLAATGNIDAGNIELLTNELEVPLYTHDVRIHANVGKEDAPPLKIGGGTNGAASITVQGTTDLGEGLTQKTGAIFLTNGPSGDIVIDGAKLHVTNEHDGTPSLIAYAGTGRVTVKGNITLDGTSSAPAGQVLLVGDEIRSTGATLSAKDTLSAPAENPAKVVLVASKLTLAGDLTIEANSKAQTSVRMVPKGSVTLDPQDNFPGIYVNVDKFPINVTEDEVLVNGSGNLTLKSKSDQAKVEITAKPLKFNNNGTSDIFATGTGSQIKIDYPGNASGQNTLVLSGGKVTLNTDNDQSNAGDVSIIADGIKGNEGADLNILSRATSTGNGGNITVSADKVNLDDSLNTMNTSAQGVAGNGGAITFNVTRNLNFSGSLLANSQGSLAGPISLTQGGAGVMTLDNIEVSSSGVTLGDGSGNSVTITNSGPNAISLLGASISAQGSGTGVGGSIHISSAANLDLTQTIITATGGENGQGGVVTIDHSTQFDVHHVIKVDAGLLTGDAVFDGIVALNGVQCRQWKTGFDWPKSFWDCTGSNPPNSIPANLAQGFDPALRNLLSNNRVLIQVFPSAAAFNLFWSDTLNQSDGGFTFAQLLSGVSTEYLYVSPFKSGNIEDNVSHAYTDPQFTEVSAHEFGHGVDIALSNGGTFPSQGAAYASYPRRDMETLDYAFADPNSLANSIRRLPCRPTPDPANPGQFFPGVPPFSAVTNVATGNSVCVIDPISGNLVLNPADFPNPPYTNSLVFQRLDGAFLNSPPPLWSEAKAQAFSIRATNPIAVTGSRPMFDQIFANGYFTCMKAWADAERVGNNGPGVPPDSCGAPDGWYVPFQQ